MVLVSVLAVVQLSVCGVECGIPLPGSSITSFAPVSLTSPTSHPEACKETARPSSLSTWILCDSGLSSVWVRVHASSRVVGLGRCPSPVGSGQVPIRLDWAPAWMFSFLLLVRLNCCFPSAHISYEAPGALTSLARLSLSSHLLRSPSSPHVAYEVASRAGRVEVSSKLRLRGLCVGVRLTSSCDTLLFSHSSPRMTNA